MSESMQAIPTEDSTQQTPNVTIDPKVHQQEQIQVHNKVREQDMKELKAAVESSNEKMDDQGQNEDGF